MPRCNIKADNGAFAVTAPYDPGFVQELKMQIQPNERRFRGEDKAWLVSTRHGKTLQDLCMKYYNEIPLLPTLANAKPKVKQMIVDVRYIGTTKDRGADERSAFGWYKDGWNVVFPEGVLRAWFDAPSNPDEQPTLYSVLGVKRDATEDEIKSGYRRMARQWHPDQCKEPNAQDQFIAIQHAYEILKDVNSRERYNAGLMFEATLKNNVTTTAFDEIQIKYNGYRAPLRCGLIMCEGTDAMGLFTVSKIFAWEDVRDNNGRVLVVSWPKGADKFQEVWA